MSTSRRDFLKVAAVTAAGAGLAACVPKAAGTAQPVGGATPISGQGPEPVTLQYLIRTDAGTAMLAWAAVTVDEWKQLHPEVTVEIISVPWGDYNAKLLTMFAAGTPPEVCGNYAGGFAQFMANNAILPLDSYIEKYKSDVSPIQKTALDAVTRDGKLWGIPLGHIPVLLFYNRDLFDKAGVQPPPKDWGDKSWTVDSFLEKAKAIARDVEDPTKAIWGTSLMWDFGGQMGTFCWNWGIDPFNNVGGPEYSEAYKTGNPTEVYYTSDKFVDFAQWVVDLAYRHKVGMLPSQTSAVEQAVSWAFLTGRVAMRVDMIFRTSALAEVAPSWKWGMAPLPYGPAGITMPNLFNDSWMLTSHSAHPEEGYQFLEYITLGNGAKRFAQMCGYAPANTKYADYWLDATSNISNIDMTRDEIKSVFLGGVDHGRPAPGKTLNRQQEFDDTFVQTTQPLLNAEVDVPTGLAAVQKAFEQVIASG